MNLRISESLQTLIAITLDDSVTDPNCATVDRGLINCLRSAGLDRNACRECILCPIARTQDLQATTCPVFEKEGFCEDVKLCEQEDCPTACSIEFEEWLSCKLISIECPDMCQEEWDELMIA